MYARNVLPKKSGESQLSVRLQELRQQIRRKDPETLARLSGASWKWIGNDHAELLFPFFEKELRLAYPDGLITDVHSGQGLPAYQQAMILYYFHTSDGTPLQGKWISFSELPEGRFYQQAFQGYSGNVLSNLFQDDLTGFEKAAQIVGGERMPFGQLAFRFLALPRVPLLVAYWQGDEDFPPSCQVLFDESVSHYLPTDVCAILGKTLTQKLTKAYKP